MDAGRWASQRPLVVVSPHHDDAAFSLGAFISAVCRLREVIVLSVFTRSAFSGRARYRATRWGSMRTTRVRAKENRRFASAVGARTIDLGLFDAPLRYPDRSVAELASWGVADEEVVPAVRKYISIGLGLRPSFDVIGPVGHGGHIDHLTVRSALNSREDVVGWYADQPYWGLGSRSPGLLAPATEIYGDQRTIGIKRDLANIYSSQPATQRMNQILAQSSSHDVVEAIWT